MAKSLVMRLALTGLLAGMVLATIDLALYGEVLKAPMADAMRALPKPRMLGLLVPWYVSLDLIAGVGLMWLYAAMRTRFGAKRSTAVIAGAAGWFFAILLPNLVQWPMNLMPLGLTATIILVALVQWPLAVMVGARFYPRESHVS